MAEFTRPSTRRKDIPDLRISPLDLRSRVSVSPETIISVAGRSRLGEGIRSGIEGLQTGMGLAQNIRAVRRQRALAAVLGQHPDILGLQGLPQEVSSPIAEQIAAEPSALAPILQARVKQQREMAVAESLAKFLVNTNTDVIRSLGLRSGPEDRDNLARQIAPMLMGADTTDVLKLVTDRGDVDLVIVDSQGNVKGRTTVKRGSLVSKPSGGSGASELATIENSISRNEGEIISLLKTKDYPKHADILARIESRLPIGIKLLSEKDNQFVRQYNELIRRRDELNARKKRIIGDISFDDARSGAESKRERLILRVMELHGYTRQEAEAYADRVLQ